MPISTPSGPGLKREYTGKTSGKCPGCPLKTDGDFAHVMVGRKSTAGLTFSFTQGSRPGRPSEATTCRLEYNI